MEILHAGRLIRRMGLDDSTGSWEEFVRGYGWRLECQVSNVLAQAGVAPRREDVEELVQDVYCRLLEQRRRRLRQFRGQSHGEVVSFLNRLARNVVVDHLRAVQAAKRRGPLMGAQEMRQPLGRLSDPGPSTESRMIVRERWRELLRGCVKRVGCRSPRRDLRILQLAFFEGMSSREIAASAFRGLSTSTIDSVVYRARQRLSAAGVHPAVH